METVSEQQYLTSTEYNESGMNNLTVHRPRRPLRFFTPSKFALTLHEINYYSYPLIVAFGTIGNILAYLVFTKTRLKKVSSLRYLAAIGVIDTGYLWTFLMNNLQFYYQKPFLTYVGVCQLVTFLNYCFTFLSIWYMVALVVDRFIALYFPHKKPSMCTVFRAKFVIVGLGALAVVCYSYVTYFYGVINSRYKGKYCGPFEVFRIQYMYLDKIDIVFVAVVPYVVIIILVLLISFRSCVRISTYATTLHNAEPRRLSSRQVPQPSVKITKLLCPVIVLTLLFIPPQNIMRTILRYSNYKPNLDINQWLSLCRMFYLLNFALKGLLYFVFSGCYRRRVKDLLCELSLKVKHVCLREAPVATDP